MKRSYTLVNDRFEHKAGTIVYPCLEYDYGLSRDDTEVTGVAHISVTLDPKGSYPFFTVPQSGLKHHDNS